MIKLCYSRKQEVSPASTIHRMDPPGAFLRSAIQLYAGAGSAPGRQQQQQQQQQFGRSSGPGAVLMLPPTQLPARTGALARRARLSPEMSLFNRLDGFVLQLESSRDFFAHWPDRICQRIRSGQQPQQPKGGEQRPAANHQSGEESPLQQNASTICWTGQNFGSYTKKLVEFGKTNMQDHPEVPIAMPTRINEMILTLIDKFRLINDQLMRQSYKLPSSSSVQYYTTKTGQVPADLRRSPAPLSPQARVISPEVLSANNQQPSRPQLQQQQQQQNAVLQAMALANALSQSVQEEANENSPADLATEDSSLDESSVSFQEDNEEDDGEEDPDEGPHTDICKDSDCNLVDQGAGGPTNPMEDFATNRQPRPSPSGGDEFQPDYLVTPIVKHTPTAPRQPIRYPPSRPADPTPPYSTITEYLDISTTHMDSGSGSGSTYCSSGLLVVLLAISSSWLCSYWSTRRTVLVVVAQH